MTLAKKGLGAVAVAIAAVGICMQPALAEQLVLKSGKVLEGDIVVRRKKSVVIKTTDGRTLEILRTSLADEKPFPSELRQERAQSQNPEAPPAFSSSGPGRQNQTGQQVDPSVVQSIESQLPTVNATDFAPMVEYAERVKARNDAHQRWTMQQMLETEGYNPAQIEQMLNEPSSEYYLPKTGASTLDLQKLQQNIEKAKSTGDFSAILQQAQALSGQVNQRAEENQKAMMQQMQEGYYGDISGGFPIAYPEGSLESAVPLPVKLPLNQRSTQSDYDSGYDESEDSYYEEASRSSEQGSIKEGNKTSLDTYESDLDKAHKEAWANMRNERNRTWNKMKSNNPFETNQ